MTPNINMDHRIRAIRVAVAVMMIAFLLAVSAFAMAEADPIRVSSLCEPQSVVSEQEVFAWRFWRLLQRMKKAQWTEL